MCESPSHESETGICFDLTAHAGQRSKVCTAWAPTVCTQQAILVLGPPVAQLVRCVFACAMRRATRRDVRDSERLKHGTLLHMLHDGALPERASLP